MEKVIRGKFKGAEFALSYDNEKGFVCTIEDESLLNELASMTAWCYHPELGIGHYLVCLSVEDAVAVLCHYALKGEDIVLIDVPPFEKPDSDEDIVY